MSYPTLDEFIEQTEPGFTLKPHYDEKGYFDYIEVLFDDGSRGFLDRNQGEWRWPEDKGDPSTWGGSAMTGRE